ncbi:MAG: hypothetical protein AB7O73_04605 [Bacteroidia bacterium]
MKKVLIILVAALTTSIVNAQNLDKILVGHKWYANADLGDDKIVFTKTPGEKVGFEVTFDKNGGITLCSVLKNPTLDKSGNEVAAGTNYCDPDFSHTIKGKELTILYPLVEWFLFAIEANKDKVIFVQKHLALDTK